MSILRNRGELMGDKSPKSKNKAQKQKSTVEDKKKAVAAAKQTKGTK